MASSCVDSGPPLGGESGGCDLNSMCLEDFKLWSADALVGFLQLRKRSIKGSKEELAARAFIAWEDKVTANPSEEHLLRCNMKDYKEKLSHECFTIPDPFTLREGWFNEESKSEWPSIYFHDICDYLRLTTPRELYHRLCNEYKQGKAYRYFTSGWVKQIYYHPVDQNSKVCLLATKVTPSMKLSSSAYEAWVAVLKDGDHQQGGTIVSAYCTCTAGLKGTCNHVAGILFRVEYAVRTGLTKPACTSEVCKWNRPATHIPTTPIELCEQVWKREHYLKSENEDHMKSVQHLATKFSSMATSQTSMTAQERVKKDLFDVVHELQPHCCVMQLLHGKPVADQQIPCPPPPFETALNVTSTNDLLYSMSLSSNDVDTIEKATRDQSNCLEWHQQRSGRITASNFHKVNSKMLSLKKQNQNCSPTSLVNFLLSGRNPVTVEMKHGKAMEPHAKKAYEKVQKVAHKRFRTRESGLHVSQSNPFLGATPDIIVSCECCEGLGICEIKCPYSIKDQIPSHVNYQHLTSTDDRVELSHKSSYYTQIQGQLAIVKAEYCDFFVYTSHGHHIERIHFDPSFWQNVSKNLTDFWLHYVAPELLTRNRDENDTDQQKLDHAYAESKDLSPHFVEHNYSKCTPKSKGSGAGPLSLCNPKLPNLDLCKGCGDAHK